MKKILLTLLIVIITTIVGIGLIFLILVEKEKTTNISDYNKYFGNDRKHKNDIFPKTIPSSTQIEDFCYYYYNPFDPNYVSYLIYTCSDEDYIKESERLSKITSSKDYLIYSSTGFSYPICAVYADSYSGYIYALTDKENKKFIYVEIKFCDYISDIDYEKIIDKKYLPINFDANKGNATRKTFEE